MAVTRRCIGLDVHREFAQIAIWEDGVVRQAGRIATTPEALRLFADSLAASDEVALEATGNTHAIVKLLRRHVARVVVSNPHKTRAIAESRVKTDKVDAQILAQLLAADYLPEVWVADEDTQARRRQVARRAHLVRQRTRLKNQVQSILHRNLVPRCPAADPFGRKGRAWLAEQELPADERRAVAALLRQLDFHGHELRLIDAELARIALGCPDTRRLMTIPRVDMTVTMGITAAVGDFSRIAALGGKRLRRTAAVGAHQELAIKVCGGELLEGEREHGEVIGRGVRAGVAGPQDRGQRLAGLVELTADRVKANPCLSVPAARSFSAC